MFKPSSYMALDMTYNPKNKIFSIYEDVNAFVSAAGLLLDTCLYHQLIRDLHAVSWWLTMFWIMGLELCGDGFNID